MHDARNIAQHASSRLRTAVTQFRCCDDPIPLCRLSSGSVELAIRGMAVTKRVKAGAPLELQHKERDCVGCFKTHT